MRASLFVTFAFLAPLLLAQPAAAQTKTTVFVGPNTRNGFVEMDAGIRDSIKDIKSQLITSQSLVSAATAENAQLVLVVLGRGRVNGGSVGFGSSYNGAGSGFVVPYESRR